MFLQRLKQAFDEINRALRATAADAHHDRKKHLFEVMIEALLKKRTSDEGHLVRKKPQLLEMVEKEMVSTRYNSKLFNMLFEIIKRQDEPEAIVNPAIKAIDALVKANENASMDAKLDIKAHYDPFIEYMKQQFELFCQLPGRIRNGEYSSYRREGAGPRTQERSLKFLTTMPNLLLHIMAYVNLNRNDKDSADHMKDKLSKVITCMIRSLVETRVLEVYESMNSEFTQDLLTILNKIMQFLFIALRNEKETDRGSTNMFILRQNASELMKNIQIKELLTNCIHLQRDCPLEFNSSRYEIAIRIKSLIGSLHNTRLSREDAVAIIRLIMQEDVKYGADSLPRLYLKNAMENHWLDIIKTDIVIHNLFPYHLYGVTEPAPNFEREFDLVERIFSVCLRTLFDANTYHHIQEKSI